jgi:hypothetical protein
VRELASQLRRDGGVGYKGIAEFAANANHRKVIPVLARDSFAEAVPSWLHEALFVCLGQQKQEGLVHRLISRRHTAVGDLADFQGASDEHN